MVYEGITNTPARPAPIALYAVEVIIGSGLKKLKSVSKR